MGRQEHRSIPVSGIVRNIEIRPFRSHGYLTTVHLMDFTVNCFMKNLIKNVECFSVDKSQRGVTIMTVMEESAGLSSYQKSGGLGGPARRYRRKITARGDEVPIPPPLFRNSFHIQNIPPMTSPSLMTHQGQPDSVMYLSPRRKESPYRKEAPCRRPPGMVFPFSR